MDKLTPDGIGGSLMDGANGITQECEDWGFNHSPPFFTNQTEEERYKEYEANHICPKCGKQTAMPGKCPCGETWKPIIYG